MIESAFFIVVLMGMSSFVAFRTRGVFSLQLIFGILTMVAIAAGFLTDSIVIASNLNGIGILAFNILLIHTGTLIAPLKSKREVMTLAVVMVVPTLVGLLFTIGLNLPFDWLIAQLALSGNGAVAAIGSNMIMKDNPTLSHVPWLFFMIQSLIGWLLIKFAGHKNDLSRFESPPECNQESSKRMYSPMVILAVLLGLALINKQLNIILAPIILIHPSITAMLIGYAAHKLKWLGKGPLNRADMMGLLMIGLISLMAKSFVNVPILSIIKALPMVFMFTCLWTITLLAIFWCAGYDDLKIIGSGLLGHPFIKQHLNEVEFREKGSFILWLTQVAPLIMSQVIWLLIT